jgi:hypothetical protein
MTKGVLIFAHNGPEVDYGIMGIISGGLAKKHLGLPVSLITDKWTIAWLKESGMYVKAESIFDKIIEIEKPRTKNTRKLHDGFYSQIIPFVNSNRFSVWDLSPYDQTLLIDSDYLIFSNRLNEYWNTDSSVMLGHSMNDITGERSGILDQRVSETGVHMFWATTVMFTKNEGDGIAVVLEKYFTGTIPTTRSESDRNQGWGEPNGGRAKITEPMHIIYGR